MFVTSHGMTLTSRSSTGRTLVPSAVLISSPTALDWISSWVSSSPLYKPLSVLLAWKLSPCALNQLRYKNICWSVISQCCFRDRKPPEKHYQGCQESVLAYFPVLHGRNSDHRNERLLTEPPFTYPCVVWFTSRRICLISLFVATGTAAQSPYVIAVKGAGIKGQ